MYGYFWRLKGVHEEKGSEPWHRLWPEPHKSHTIISLRTEIYLRSKGKAIPLQAWTSP